MNDQAKMKLRDYASILSNMANNMRDLSKGDDIEQRESDGLQVLSVELDAIVEGISNLLGPKQ